MNRRAAQQTVAQQGVRGCAAELCFLAERAYEASPCALVSCWEAPVHQQPGATAEEASAVLVPMHALRLFQRASRRHPDTLFVVAPRDCSGTCDESSDGHGHGHGGPCGPLLRSLLQRNFHRAFLIIVHHRHVDDIANFLRIERFVQVRQFFHFGRT